MRQYVSNEFRDDHENTVGVEFESKDIDIDSTTKIKIQVWDTVYSFLKIFIQSGDV